jgi:hypothetical protein
MYNCAYKPLPRLKLVGHIVGLSITAIMVAQTNVQSWSTGCNNEPLHDCIQFERHSCESISTCRCGFESLMR